METLIVTWKPCVAFDQFFRNIQTERKIQILYLLSKPNDDHNRAADFSVIYFVRLIDHCFIIRSLLNHDTIALWNAAQNEKEADIYEFKKQPL